MKAAFAAALAGLLSLIGVHQASPHQALVASAAATSAVEQTISTTTPVVAATTSTPSSSATAVPDLSNYVTKAELNAAFDERLAPLSALVPALQRFIAGFPTAQTITNTVLVPSYSSSGLSAPLTVGGWAASQKIDNLSGTNISNAAISGGTISGATLSNAVISGTASFVAATSTILSAGTLSLTSDLHLFALSDLDSLGTDATGKIVNGGAMKAIGALATLYNTSAPNVIFDDDFNSDPEGASALGLLHALADRGEVNILATIIDTSDNNAVCAMQAVNSYYGRASIAVARIPDAIYPKTDAFSSYLAQNFPNSICSTQAFPNATKLMRQVLASQPDESVTLIVTGTMVNLYNLYHSDADLISSLTGQSLMQRKLKKIVIMGGDYPASTNEHNFIIYPGPTQVINDIAQNLPTLEVAYIGKTLGDNVTTNMTSAPFYSPVRTARAHVNQLSEASWDQLAVLYAVRGLGYDGTTYFALTALGRNTVNAGGQNTFISGSGSQYYLSNASSYSSLGLILNELTNASPLLQGTSPWTLRGDLLSSLIPVNIGSSTIANANITNANIASGRSASFSSVTVENLNQDSLDLLSFNGAASGGSYVSVPSAFASNQIFGSSAFSIEAWIYPRSSGGNNGGRIVDKMSGNYGYRLLVVTSGSALQIIMDFGNGTGYSRTTTSSTVPLNSWSHIAVSWRGGAPHVYINGVEASYSSVATLGTPPDDSPYSLYIGNRSAGGSTFDGFIKSIRLYRNKGLSSSEVFTLYNAGKAAVSPVAGNTAQYLFTEGAGSTLGDTSGNGNNGTISAASWTTYGQATFLNSRVGIGTTTPWRTLSITGTVGIDGLTGTTGAGSLCLTATREVVYNSGSDNCLSSLRETKHDINPIAVDAFAQVLALQPVSFIYNNDASSTVRYGFIADDAVAVDPHLGTYDAEGKLSGVDDRSIISIVVKAVQTLAAKVSGFADTFTTRDLTYTRAVGDELVTKKLCIGSTCITESQLQEILAGQPATAATAAGGGGNDEAEGLDDTPQAPPTIEIQGNNPATITVGDAYADLGAIITGPTDALNLGIHTFVGTTPIEQAVIDTSAPTTYHIYYVVTGTSGLTSTSTRTVIVAAEASPAPATTVTAATSTSQ